MRHVIVLLSLAAGLLACDPIDSTSGEGSEVDGDCWKKCVQEGGHLCKCRCDPLCELPAGVDAGLGGAGGR